MYVGEPCLLCGAGESAEGAPFVITFDDGTTHHGIWLCPSCAKLPKKQLEATLKETMEERTVWVAVKPIEGPLPPARPK